MASWTASLTEMKRAEMGLYGSTFESGTTAITGSWCEILCVTETTFDLLTGGPAGDTFTGVAIPAGTRLKGLFTAIKLTGGSIIALKTGAGV